MTDTPGWVAPGSPPEPPGGEADPRDAAPARPAASAALPGAPRPPADEPAPPGEAELEQARARDQRGSDEGGAAQENREPAAAQTPSQQQVLAEQRRSPAAVGQSPRGATPGLPEAADAADAATGRPATEPAPGSGYEAPAGASGVPAPTVPTGHHGPFPPPGAYGHVPPPGAVPPGYPAGPGWGIQPPPPPGPHWGWQQPLFPKPGVIPLRPLGVGEVLDGAVSTLRTYWRPVLGVSVVVAVVTQAARVLIDWWTQRGLGDTMQQLQDQPGGDWRTLGKLYSQLFSGAAVSGVISLLGTLIATALLTVVISRAVLGKPVTLAEAWAEARPRLLRLLGLTLLTLLVGAAVVVVALLPGIVCAAAGAPTAVIAALMALGALAAVVAVLWLMTSLSLAPSALMLEKQGILTSWGRSMKLVRGAWWRIFGITLLTGILTLIFSALIGIPFGIIGVLLGSGSSGLLGSTGGTSAIALAVTGIGAAISSTLTVPISAGVRVLLYIDQRIRREALDMELARAAGVPGYDAPTGAGA